MHLNGLSDEEQIKLQVIACAEASLRSGADRLLFGQ